MRVTDWDRPAAMGAHEPLVQISLVGAGRSLDEYAEVVRGRRVEGRTEVRRKDGTTLSLRFRASETRVAGLPFYVGVAWPA